MEWNQGALALFFQIVVPLLIVVAIAYAAYRWSTRDQPPSFTGTEPERRETTEEYHFELEDVHDPDDHPPRV